MLIRSSPFSFHSTKAIIQLLKVNLKLIKALKDAYSEAKMENKTSANLKLKSVKDGQNKHKEKIMARELRREGRM